MKTVIYSRVSEKDPAKSKTLINGQEKCCLAEAKKLGCDNITLIKDEGELATNLNRPGLKKMVELCEKKEIGQIITINSDRLSRNTTDHLSLLNFFKQRGVKIHYALQSNTSAKSAEEVMVDGVINNVIEFQKSQTIWKKLILLVKQLKSKG